MFYDYGYDAMHNGRMLWFASKMRFLTILGVPGLMPGGGQKWGHFWGSPKMAKF